MSGLAPESVRFKITPSLIPTANIERNGKCAIFNGGFGDIWKCSMVTQSGTRRFVAVKSIRIPSLTDVEKIRAIGKRVRREAYVWILLEHNHILPFEGVTVAEEFGPLPALVSPWMDEGTLEDYLNREFPGMPDLRKRDLIWQVTAGISYLHGKGIVHGDLTATNVLVDSSGCLRLADFGLSMILAESGNATFNSCHPGNIRWMPPEALQGEGEDEGEIKDGKSTKAWDVYSYGCVALQIFSGNQPYTWITKGFSVMGAIQRGLVPFRNIQSHGVCQQLSPCLNKISADRPTMDDIVKVLGPR